MGKPGCAPAIPRRPIRLMGVMCWPPSDRGRCWPTAGFKSDPRPRVCLPRPGAPFQSRNAEPEPEPTAAAAETASPSGASRLLKDSRRRSVLRRSRSRRRRRRRRRQRRRAVPPFFPSVRDSRRRSVLRRSRSWPWRQRQPLLAASPVIPRNRIGTACGDRVMARDRHPHHPKVPKLKQDPFEEANAKAVKDSKSKRPTQSSYNDLDIIRIPYDPTAYQLLGMYREIHNLFVKHNSVLVPRKVRMTEPAGGFPENHENNVHYGVPVTLPYDKKNLNFFIIEILKGDERYQIPMRLDSLYCCGFRLLFPGDDVLNKLWYSFGKIENLPEKLFKNRIRSGLSIAYNDITRIQLYKGVISKICSYMHNFQPVTKFDPKGTLLKDTLYFMFSESSRYAFAMARTFKGVESYILNPVRLNDLMSDLIKDWGDGSSKGLFLWLAFLEKNMGLFSHRSGSFPDLFEVFKNEAEDFFKYEPLLKFKNDAGEWCLSALVGQSLFILKYDSVLGRKCLMRSAAYSEVFPKMEPLKADIESDEE